MAFGGSFKADHPYATGILLIIVAGFGVAGSVTGQLAAMLAALWVPSALQPNTSYGQGSGSSSDPGAIQRTATASTGAAATGSTINTGNAPTVGSTLAGGGTVASA